MTTLTRGSQFDIAFSGQRPPIDIWSIATEGIWKKSQDLPPPECWTPVLVGADQNLLITLEQQTSQATIDSDQSLTIKVDDSIAVVSVSFDEILKVRIC